MIIIIIATSVSSYRPSLFTFLGKSCTLGPLTCVEKGNMQWYVRDKKNNVMTVYQMMFVLLNSNTTGVISGTGTDNPSGAPVFTVVFSGVCVAQSCFLCSVVKISVSPFLLFSCLTIILSVHLPFTA